MIKKIKRLTIPICLTLLLAFIYWQPQDNPASIKELNTPPSDYYFQNVELKQFSEKGELLSQVNAKKMEHFLTTNSSIITSPKVTFTSEKKATWQLLSNRGEYSHDANQLVLDGDIVISETFNSNNTLIQTQSLSLNLNNKSAFTDEKVQIKTNRSLTHATGMQADFHKDLIHLKAQVSTEVLPNDS
ncbi:LPS export ABC transporter periplasmic protein LptC [Aliikangiella sp. IMCC44359]|uniref:LPS export ABC transporter periplasmic protein LptC n=1 Tax=Aliikangiella sp. IMCC44359 TaxID=3459125 RepID=UPI00403B18FD